MSNSEERLHLRDVRAIFRLVGELRELGADPNIWRPHMLASLRRIVAAQVVVSSEIHFRATGKPNVMRVVDSGWGCDEAGGTWQIHTEREDERPETYWLSVWQPAHWTVPGQTETNDALIPVVPQKKVYGGTAFILSQIPLPHLGTVDQLGLHRAWGDEAFTRAQHRLVRLLHLELGRLWSVDALRKAKDPHNDLPPRLSQTLALLLEGCSEKEIAGRLELSKHTIHNYVKALHQRFDVSSRGELLAKAGKQIRPEFRPRLMAEGATPNEK
ncbi:MAG: LuxR C-terminal-related transcriptional regulator [Tepidisphaeraceae bacterium]|jgi:DNA-binding CsgD family transcriptional regulator